jgi:hypothetical protein
MGLGIVREISLRDVLSVARKIDKADRLVVEHPQEAGPARRDAGYRVDLRR